MTQDEVASLLPGERVRIQAMRWFAAPNDRAHRIAALNLPEPAVGIVVRTERLGSVVRPWRTGAGMAVRWHDDGQTEEIGDHDLGRLSR